MKESLLENTLPNMFDENMAQYGNLFRWKVVQYSNGSMN